MAKPNLDLVLEGIDTYSTVKLVSFQLSISHLKLKPASERTCSSAVILFLAQSDKTQSEHGPRTENQFVSYRVPAKDHLKEGDNELVLDFQSTFLKVNSSLNASDLLGSSA